MLWRRNKAVRIAIVVAALVGCSSEDGLPPGASAVPYPVGFRTEQVLRHVSGDQPRRLTLSAWYPATSPGESPVLYGDLFELALEERQLTEPVGLSRERGLAAAMTGDTTSLGADEARALLNTPTEASWRAQPARGPFPIALWSTRHATVLAQAPMAEALASEGIVVATVWSSDPPLAFLWEDRPAAEKAATIASHTLDLERALDVLGGDPGIDRNRVISLAWSYGGQTAAELQEREDAVQAVIGLDANVVPARPEERLELVKPLVYFVGRDVADRGFEQLGGLSAPWVAVRFPGLAHGNFNALEGYLPGLYGADTVFSWSQGGEVAVEGYLSLVRMVTEATVSFLDDPLLDAGGLAERLARAAGSTRVEITHSGSRE